MEIIQSIYIFILNAMYQITGKIDKRIRDVVIIITMFFFIALSIARYCSPTPKILIFEGIERDIIGCICLAVIAIMSIDGKLKKVKWNRQFVIIWYGLSGLMFLSGYLHSVEVSYWLWSIALLTGFPGFYLIWQNRGDYDRLYKSVSCVMIIAIFGFLVVCLKTISSADFVSGRYEAVLSNVNHLGKLAVAGMTASLYMVFAAKNKWVYLVAAGISLEFALLSVSRAALLIISVQVLLVVIFKIKQSHKNIICKQNILVMVSMLMVVIGTVAVVEKGLMYCKQLHDKENQSVESAETKKPYCTDMEKDILKIKKAQIIDMKMAIADVEEKSDALNSLEGRMSIENKDLNQISSGRIELWKYFISRLNILGNNWKKTKPGTPEYNYRLAHNDILEISYRSGVIAGFFEILFLLYMSLYVLKKIFFRTQVDSQDLYVCLAIIAYVGYAMFEIIAYPFRVHYVFMLYIALMPLFDRESEIKMRKV